MGDDTDPDRVGAWVESTRQACTALRQMTGVDRVWLVGLRLGALVAALAARSNEDVAGIVALAPVVVGKSYLRELSVLQSTLELAGPPAGIPAEPKEGVETLGFAISHETRTALSQINLATMRETLGVADDRFEVLVLDRDDLPAGMPWIEHLKSRGVRAELEQAAGYSTMMVDPHKSVVPEAMIERTVDWLSQRPRPAARLHPSVRVDVREQATMGDVVEAPIFVDDQQRLFGVLTRPAKAKPSGRSILLLNAGSIHHVGPNRLHVRLARTWAAEGHEVLRLDLTGLGESSRRRGQDENVVYSSFGVEDVVSAVEYVRRRGASDIRPVGLCSGAYFAMKSATATKHVAGFVAINPLTFDKPPPGPTDYPRVRTARETARYRRSMRDVEKWKKLLRGKVRVAAVASTVARHLGDRAVKYGRLLARRLDLPLAGDVGAELMRMAERNIEQRFIFASEDPGKTLLDDEAGDAVRKLEAAGILRIDMIEGADHTFTARWSHGQLIELLTTAITR